ncbi:MAG: magnesium transporter CorA [Candidatus Diapherotrites archaeon]|uniref:Magnesium transporter CorA n=1 Tax=Candidatus Iainarchaeum sp. TaxID=3101447 RepID=A0A8T4L7X7_9ARCH|nr:magnesium transporter CorA [Candidatus Diapherotrites archaeon]
MVSRRKSMVAVQPVQFMPAVSSKGEERSAFCVALPGTGDVVKIESEDCSDFADLVAKSTISWVDYWAYDMAKDGREAVLALGFSEKIVNLLFDGRTQGYEDLDTELGLVLPAVNVEGLEVVVSPLLILIRRNVVVTVHGRAVTRLVKLRRYAETFMRKIPKHIPSTDKQTLVLVRIVDENNGRNFDHLREIEEQGDALSKHLMDPKTPRRTLGPKIYKMKHALITYLSTLWVSLDVLNTLRLGDAEQITDDPQLLARVGVLSDDVNRQIQLSEHMSEVLASGLEVLQSIYNNQLQVLNNRMALVMTYLTVLGTAVLVPNTLATIFSNPAFNMQPKDIGWYTVLLVVSTLASSYAAYWWTKKQGAMPKNSD